MQKHVNLVDLVKSFPTNIFLQNLASIQKRTSPIKFAHLAENQSKIRYRTFQLRFKGAVSFPFKTTCRWKAGRVEGCYEGFPPLLCWRVPDRLVAMLRRRMNIELNFPPNFEGLVLGCTSYGARPQARAVNLSLMINLVWKFFENFQNFLKNFQKKIQKFFGNFGEAVDFFADRFEKFATRGGAKAGGAGRSRQVLHVAYFVAKFGLYPDENEPRQIWQIFADFRH